MKNESLQLQKQRYLLLLLSPTLMLLRPLRAYVRQEEFDVSPRSSFCALRLIKARTQVAQEMKLPTGVAEIACYKILCCF